MVDTTAENARGVHSAGDSGEKGANSTHMVEFPVRTLAYLETPQSQPSSDDEETEKMPRRETGDSLWKLIGNVLPVGVNVNTEANKVANANAQPKSSQRRRTGRKKPLSNPLTEEELAAPYVGEETPEHPELLRTLSREVYVETPDSEQPSTEASEAMQQAVGAGERLRQAFHRARGAVAVRRLFAAGARNLQDVGTTTLLNPTFPSALLVPLMWARRDHKYRHSPPVFLDALKLAISDSEVDDRFFIQRFIYVYRIELEYGDIKWVVKKSSYDYLTLSLNLSRRKDLPELPRLPLFVTQFMNKFTKENPSRPHQTRRQLANLEKRNELQEWLLQILKILNTFVPYDLYEFLELSAISITRDMGWKGKEGYLDNKVEHLHTRMCSFRNTTERWEREWVILRDSYIAFCADVSSTIPSDVFLLDKDFKCTRIEKQGFAIHDHVLIENGSRRIELKGEKRTLDEFIVSTNQLQKSSPWVKRHRYDSYAPIRTNAKVKWYVDGKDYFYAVSEAILAAKTEIYIEDWWLSPELYLRRPPAQNEKFRLDRLLKRKAEEGVMIYVVIYKEVTYALTLDSQYTKTTLQKLHPNIKVQRHPDHGPDGTMFWAHHEKIVVVDCRMAFIGGLDLCYGRYDTHDHELVDNPPIRGSHTVWKGQDYSNPRVKDFVNVREFDVDLVDKSNVPRMPWHDVSVGMIGTPARDVARHFVQRWNFIKQEKASVRESIPLLTPKGEYVSTRDETKFKGHCNVQLLRSSAPWSSGIKRENSIYNVYCHLIAKAKHFIYIENQFFVTRAAGGPNCEIKNRIGERIVERIKQAHEKKEKFRVIVCMPLLPAFEADLSSKDAGTIRMVMHWQYTSICRGGHSILEQLHKANINPDDYISFFALRGYDTITRSDVKQSRSNSGSTKKTENKIAPIAELAGHVKEPAKAPSIEPSNTEKLSQDRQSLSNEPSEQQQEKPPEMEQPKVKPYTIGEQPSEQIKEQVKEELQDKPPSPVSPRQHSNELENGSEDVNRSHEHEKSKDSFSDEQPASLRHYKITSESLHSADANMCYVTEEIYIHSKVLIVDDKYAVIGSANLNDRSQLGDRDSEIAIVVEDQKTIKTYMDGKKYEAAKFAYTLRSSLFKEHLGLIPAQDHSSATKSCLPPFKRSEHASIHVHGHDISITQLLCESETQALPKHPTKEDLIVMDPLSDEFYNYWKQTAQNNTEAYRAVFRCVPDDLVTNWEQYHNFVPDQKEIPTGHAVSKDLLEQEEKLNRIRGHLVCFPSHFLEDEHLLGSILTSAVTPAEIFT